MTCAFAITKDKYGVEVSVDPKQWGTAPSSVTHDDLAKIVALDEKLLSKAYAEKLHPTVSGVFEFWALASTDARHFEVDNAIHFKTNGDSWFLKKFFHTKAGDFTGKDGGEVSISLYFWAYFLCGKRGLGGS